MDKKWYRVVDPLNPLYGCDVTGTRVAWDSETDETLMIGITGMRRVDVFVGDRPFQLIAKEGETLGLWIDKKCLEESAIQDETVELVTDRPFGRCISESDMTRVDGVTLRIARYEHGTQIAILSGGQLLHSSVDTSVFRDTRETLVLQAFESNAPEDDMIYMLKRNEA